jgi:hypothetical protein
MLFDIYDRNENLFGNTVMIAVLLIVIVFLSYWFSVLSDIERVIEIKNIYHIPNGLISPYK